MRFDAVASLIPRGPQYAVQHGARFRSSAGGSTPAILRCMSFTPRFLVKGIQESCTTATSPSQSPSTVTPDSVPDNASCAPLGRALSAVAILAPRSIPVPLSPRGRYHYLNRMTRPGGKTQPSLPATRAACPVVGSGACGPPKPPC